MIDLANRSDDLEIMDDLYCSGPVVAQTLRELEFINKWLGGNRVTIDAVASLERKIAKHHLSIIDVGCGSGEMLILLNEWTEKRKIQSKLTGIDANPNIVELARRNCKNFPSIEFGTMDILSPEFNTLEADIVTGTLFYHHFTNTQLIRFFDKLKDQVRIGFVINDIHRHPVAYYSIKLLTTLFSRSEMVKYDAPLSVRRGFTRKELESILYAAGCRKFRINWKWAFRWQVVVEK